MKLSTLIELALIELGHNTCPYCQRIIRADLYVTPEDVEKWLEKLNMENGEVKE